jgi:DNA-directed RNA polymerase beta' subunit
MIKKHCNLLLGLYLLLSCCQSNENNIITNISKDTITNEYKVTNLSKDTIGDFKIINAVEKELDRLTKGIEQLNSDSIFSVFSNNNGTLYLREGYIYPSIETAKNDYKQGFKDLNLISQKITFSSKSYVILNKNLVLMTAMGSIIQIKKTKTDFLTKIKKIIRKPKPITPWNISYSILWMQDDKGWKILNMHISWL